MLSLPTKILPKTLLDGVKRTRPVYAAGRRMRFALGSRLGARVVPGLPGRVHYNDFMLTSPAPADVESYRRGALQFVDIIEQSLQQAGRDFASVEACLEVGCGYGRIVRELRARVAPSRIHVTDVIDEGARFAAAEFGVRRVPLLEAAGGEWNACFDLVYLLSVYTHLRRDLVEANLRRVTDVLKPGGIVVFTIHGPGSAATAERYGQYWLDQTKLREALASDGYFYERYPYYYGEYGLTWFTRDCVQSLVDATAPALQLVSYRPMAVDGHQDVYVYRKRVT